ncbi:Coenzyme F420 hydrogenase/dehydrogenase, beta subunit C-terminal domain [Thermophilibacter sp. ZX-H3]|uniref:Coenzyme F420 hydrogenase/dehydrogenase, beta subunit C-terminal domain n=1 Tax=unclassified Thermophilibacter TaxID=2847308 RepID=UPI004040B4F0
MACIDICAHGAIQIQDDIRAYNAVIDADKCINCGLCDQLCQQNHPASLREPLEWKQGWAVDSEERVTSSSGGVAAAISKAFVNHGGVVCSCAFRDGRFGFEIAESGNDLERFKGSKYVKSDPTGAYRTVRSLLRTGRCVLFIGLPCQVSSMRNYCSDDEKLFTIDLICHGTPSPKILKGFLAEHGFDMRRALNIGFRKKTNFAVYYDGNSVDVPNVTDCYSIAFLNGLDYTENCYSCKYAQGKRVADITIGDSWGTDLKQEIPLGVSLLLVQTKKGKGLLSSSGIELHSVDIEAAVKNNSQLMRPSAKPSQRLKFLSLLRKKTFDTATRRCLFLSCGKQNLKRLLIRLNLI